LQRAGRFGLRKRHKKSGSPKQTWPEWLSITAFFFSTAQS